MSETQDLKNHGRLHPPFHIVTFVLLVTNLVFAITHFAKQMTVWNGWIVVLSLGIFVPVLLIRIYPLKVQDRLIRLEEGLRLQSLAPAEWRAQIYRLTADQLIGLRFAGDDEVVPLAKQALEENLTRKQIKERIKTWRADFFRI
jgi:hypothetical protein